MRLPIELKIGSFYGEKLGAALLFLGLICTPTPAFTQKTENQFWPEAKVCLTLSGKTRLYFDYAGTRKGDLSYSDGLVQASLDFYVLRLYRSKERGRLDAARGKTLMIRAGYFLDRTPADSPDPYIAHVPSVEIHSRVELPGKILVSDRNRIDFRILDGVYKPRYGNRLKVERTFRRGKLELNPYVDGEFFYGWQYDRFFRSRLETGVEWTATRHFILEGCYTRQWDTYPTDGAINAIGVVLQFYLRNK